MSKALHVEVCSNCHPFYTGKQKIVDTAGRVRSSARNTRRSPRPLPRRPEFQAAPKGS